jgi:beta-N-acetylhexosaminidase
MAGGGDDRRATVPRRGQDGGDDGGDSNAGVPRRRRNDGDEGGDSDAGVPRRRRNDGDGGGERRASVPGPLRVGRDRRAVVLRRRRLAAAAAVAFIAGLVAGASSGSDEPGGPTAPRGLASPAGDSPAGRERSGAMAAAVDRLTLSQQVGQTLVLRFAGTTAPGYVRRALRERRAAGVVLFRDNVVSPGQLRALTAALRAAGGRPLVAVDQEGGDIRILPWAPPFSSAPAQAAAGTVEQDARAAARALRAAGVTVSLAPVADVPSVTGAALAGRELGTSTEAVADAVRAAVEGWLAGGVAPTAKHFPGLGAAQVNTDDGPATVTRATDRLAAVDLPPFAAAVEAGVPLVMVGHARYPGVDGARIASQSPRVIALLRERLGFRGVVITDSMEAAASLATGTVEEASQRALEAGADLLLLTGRGSFTPVHRALLTAARRSRVLRERVREAAARVLALKAGPVRPPG